MWNTYDIYENERTLKRNDPQEFCDKGPKTVRIESGLDCNFNAFDV